MSQAVVVELLCSAVTILAGLIECTVFNMYFVHLVLDITKYALQILTGRLVSTKLSY